MGQREIGSVQFLHHELWLLLEIIPSGVRPTAELAHLDLQGAPVLSEEAHRVLHVHKPLCSQDPMFTSPMIANPNVHKPSVHTPYFHKSCVHKLYVHKALRKQEAGRVVVMGRAFQPRPAFCQHL